MTIPYWHRTSPIAADWDSDRQSALANIMSVQEAVLVISPDLSEILLRCLRVTSGSNDRLLRAVDECDAAALRKAGLCEYGGLFLTVFGMAVRRELQP